MSFIQKMLSEKKSKCKEIILNHLKKCTPSSSSSHDVWGAKNESNSSSSISTSTAVRRVSGMNTLDSFAKWSGKEVGEERKIMIYDRTATGVAAYHITLSRLIH